ncbi:MULTISPECIES: AMP-binding protein [Klebsiella]|uniref:AMP-binding protein n=1 Tax=Klebsiella TaxID=570 RepID=UPI000E2C1F6A|nr:MULTISPECIES: AMP-binding protein [Klebsiella]MBB3335590.1 acyl-coenzyme A synthetase/AMP-(fatty) acid ligase [Klebsiella sp. RC2]MBC4752367.1 acyl-CoA synthetase [Klebsiella variicola]MDV1441833.1 AMP-binding protein [Klebsiella variicola subsp. variicola]WJP94245.1 AMP-binding protein [Klebsiella variicola]SXF15355.1 acyl-CoA synthetase [Klebsiella variicola]
MKQPLPLDQWLSAPRSPETPIAWQDAQVWTLAHLRHDVVRLLTHLRQQPGARWALCIENSYLFIVALLATLHAGKTPVLPGHGRLSLLNEQKALFDGLLSDKALAWDGPLLKVESTMTPMRDETDFPAPGKDARIELFTSGSTGQPKPISKPIDSLDHEAALLSAHYAGRLTGCRVVASVAPQHLYGLTFRLFLPMALGLPLHAAMLEYPEQLTALSHQHRYLFISSPAFLKRLDHRLPPPPMAMIVSAGGQLLWRDAMQAASWCNTWPDEIYGSTESGVIACRPRLQDQAPWQPFPGIRFQPEGDTFRLFSPLVADNRGLLLDDILHFTESGHFQLAGRRDRVVKIEEKRISLSEVEQRLLELEGVIDAAVLPITRGSRQSIGVLLVLNHDARRRWGKSQELQWRKALRPLLEPVAIPRFWRVVDEIPLNSMNKRVYAQLQELFHAAP